jgi:hypothetical protein
MDDLTRRVEILAKAFPAFAEDLRFALSNTYTNAQPPLKASLNATRTILEKLLIQLYLAKMGKEPRTPMLKEMLNDNQFTRKLERRIIPRMNFLREVGNLGTHGIPVKPKDAARGVDDLCEVLEWYLEQHPAGPEAPSGTVNPWPALAPSASPATDSQGPASQPSTVLASGALHPLPPEPREPPRPAESKVAPQPSAASPLLSGLPETAKNPTAKDPVQANEKAIAVPPPQRSFVDDAIDESVKLGKFWIGGWLRYVWILFLILSAIGRTPAAQQSIENSLKGSDFGEMVLFLFSLRGFLLTLGACIGFSIIGGISAALFNRWH